MNTSWFAGLGKCVITPQNPMWLSGYASRTRPAEGKLHDLWCKALALMDRRGRCCVLVTLDLVGIDRRLMQSIQRQILDRYQLPAESIRLACSHTHTGPVVRGNLSPMYDLSLEQRRFIDEYGDWLEAQITNAIGQALRDLQPSQLCYGQGRSTFAVNRRTNKEADVPGLQATGKLQGPVDHDVPVLQVCDEKRNQRAVVFGYACHATVLDSYQWSGDYPGFAQLELEKRYPGTMALFWQGCGGDQNPLPRRKVELAEKYGKQLAGDVQAALGQPLTPITGSLQQAYEEIPLEFGALPTVAELTQQMQDKNKYTALRAKQLLEEIHQGKPLSKYYPYPVQTWMLGDGPIWIGLGGEVVVDYALRLKKEIVPGPIWVNGYSNDVMAYIPSLRVLREGGYEGGGAMVYYGLPGSWSQEVEKAIIATVCRQVTDMK